MNPTVLYYLQPELCQSGLKLKEMKKLTLTIWMKTVN